MLNEWQHLELVTLAAGALSLAGVAVAVHFLI